MHQVDDHRQRGDVHEDGEEDLSGPEGPQVKTDGGLGGGDDHSGEEEGVSGEEENLKRRGGGRGGTSVVIFEVILEAAEGDEEGRLD